MNTVSNLFGTRFKVDTVHLTFNTNTLLKVRECAYKAANEAHASEEPFPDNRLRIWGWERTYGCWVRSCACPLELEGRKD